MCYEEADYRAEMEAQAQAQGEYEAEAAHEYEKYLDGLIDNKQYQLFAIEICQDYLNSIEFRDSKLTALEFLSLKKERLLHPEKYSKDLNF